VGFGEGGGVPIFVAAIVPRGETESETRWQLYQGPNGEMSGSDPDPILHTIDELTETNARSSHTLTHC